MKILLIAAAAASVLAIAAPASADIYANLGYSAIDADGPDLGAITGRLGWKSATPFGVEGEISTGVADDTVGGVKVEFDKQIALYGTASVAASDTVSLFGRVGVGWETLRLKPGGSDTQTSVNYGVGANWMFAGPNGVRVEYTRVDFDQNSFRDSNVYSLSYVRKF